MLADPKAQLSNNCFCNGTKNDFDYGPWRLSLAPILTLPFQTVF